MLLGSDELGREVGDGEAGGGGEVQPTQDPEVADCVSDLFGSRWLISVNFQSSTYSMTSPSVGVRSSSHSEDSAAGMSVIWG